jgi:hypothetical protein
MGKVFRVSSLIVGLVFFAVFMVAACAAYYLTAGVFVTSSMAALYAALGLLGALSMVLRAYIFASLFYIGCALGWATGHYVSTLQGDFAPTAGVIATFFLIGCFGLVGFLLEVGRLRRRLRRKAEKREAERQAEKLKLLLAEQKAEPQTESPQQEASPKSTEGGGEPAAGETPVP